FSPGVLNFLGNLFFKPAATLKIELGGMTQGTNYDYVNVTNAVVLAGSLQVWLINGFQTTIPPGAIFTVLTAGGGLTGGFANVASGSRLTTADGFGSFVVTYDSKT